MDAIERLRDAIQDLLFFRHRPADRSEFTAAIGEACKALEGLPARVVTTLEAIDGAEWRTRLRISLAKYGRDGSNEDAQRLVEVQDQLWALSESTPESAGSKRGITVDQRMRLKFQELPESMGWSARQWAEHLGCSKSVVIDSSAWESLKLVKADAKLAKATLSGDRRRKPKRSDSKRPTDCT